MWWLTRNCNLHAGGKLNSSVNSAWILDGIGYSTYPAVCHSPQNIQAMLCESKPSSSKAKQTGLDITSPANRLACWELKNVESKTPDFPIVSSFMRKDCRLMLLILRVLQLWLTKELYLVNNIRSGNISTESMELVVSFLMQHTKTLLLL